jgi:hypothetical protein
MRDGRGAESGERCRPRRGCGGGHRRNSALPSCSPECCGMARRTFSRTVSFPMRRRSWNVRATPMRAIRKGAEPLRGFFPKRIFPASGRTNPVTRLKSVVLPEPLPPSRQVIAPEFNSKLARSGIVRPGKRKHKCSTDSISSLIRWWLVVHKRATDRKIECHGAAFLRRGAAPHTVSARP